MDFDLEDGQDVDGIGIGRRYEQETADYKRQQTLQKIEDQSSMKIVAALYARKEAESDTLMDTCTNHKSRLFSLPPELFNTICQMVLIHPDKHVRYKDEFRSDLKHDRKQPKSDASLESDVHPLGLHLLAVCRALFFLGVGMFYSENSFAFYPPCVLAALMPRHAHRFRHIRKVQVLSLDYFVPVGWDVDHSRYFPHAYPFYSKLFASLQLMSLRFLLLDTEIEESAMEVLRLVGKLPHLEAFIFESQPGTEMDCSHLLKMNRSARLKALKTSGFVYRKDRSRVPLWPYPEDDSDQVVEDH